MIHLNHEDIIKASDKTTITNGELLDLFSEISDLLDSPDEPIDIYRKLRKLINK